MGAFSGNNYQARVEYNPRRPSEVPATGVDIGRAKELLGWPPRVDYALGIENPVKCTWES